MIKYILILFFSFLTYTVSAQTCTVDFEDFEGSNNSNPPTGWQRLGSYIGTSFPYAGTTHAGFNSIGDQLIIEPLNCPGEICFYWRASGFSSDYDLDIDYSDDGGSTWQTVQTISLNGSGSPTTYNQLCVDLPETNYSPPSTGILIRFHQSRRNSGSFYLDDVCISSGLCSVNASALEFIAVQPACLQVVSPFSATVCATDGAGNVDVSYQGTIQLTTASGPSTLNGVTSKIAQQGCATFDNLTYNQAGNYMLSASDSNWSVNSTMQEVLVNCPIVSQLRVMSYNLLNFPNGRNDCGSNTVVSARWDTLAKITAYSQPDILMVCELQNEIGADMILQNAFHNVLGANYQRSAFVPNRSTGNKDLNNIVFYNTNKLSLHRQSEILTNVRDISYYVFLVNDPGLAVHADSTFLDVYVGHLKAGSADSLARTQACDLFRAVVDTASSNRNAVFGGDFNFYRAAESGYQRLLSGIFPFYDPVNASGEWNNNASFSAVHTQSTRSSGEVYDCGATGGMDDRFDFILASDPVLSGAKNIQYIPDSYTALGNSSNLFNRSINDPLNSSGLPDSIVQALFYMSDHLPVLMDLNVQLPAVNLASELVLFEAERTNNANAIKWLLMNDEEASLKVALQRSDDAINFQTIDVSTSYESTIIGGHEDVEYVNKNAYYRLQITGNETIQYSPVKALFGQSSDELPLTLFPNPSSGKVYLMADALKEKEVTVEISDVLGNRLQTMYWSELPSSRLAIDLKGCVQGIYFVHCRVKGYASKIFKLKYKG